MLPLNCHLQIVRLCLVLSIKDGKPETTSHSPCSCNIMWDTLFVPGEQPPGVKSNAILMTYDLVFEHTT